MVVKQNHQTFVSYSNNSFYNKNIYVQIICLFALCFIMLTAAQSQSHTGTEGKKQSALWELQEYSDPYFPISIAWCLPLPWHPGSVRALCLQAALDLDNLAWMSDAGMTSSLM